ncbi:MAG TPA: hypothetical protein EYN31_07225 [Candidatus Marinimicrobia bacterium]|nr:hypothetical protein [Candidatus Neomarinimicrobiota bacterium]
MSLKLFNTLSGKLETFKPLDGETVRMYSCGPTVYDVPHIGNFRAFLFPRLPKGEVLRIFLTVFIVRYPLSAGKLRGINIGKPAIIRKRANLKKDRPAIYNVSVIFVYKLFDEINHVTNVIGGRRQHLR